MKRIKKIKQGIKSNSWVNLTPGINLNICKMMKIGGMAAIIVLVVSLSGCIGGGGKQTLSIAGSTTVQPISMKAAEIYMSKHPDVQVLVQGGGSGTGIKMVAEGSVDIGASSRNLKDKEKSANPDLVAHVIASDGIAVITHSANTLDDLTKEQVQDIFSGKIKNFNEIGGPDKKIVVVIREEGSGTRSAFEELVMDKGKIDGAQAALQKPSNGAVKATVASNENAIGYIGIGYIDSSVRAMKIEGVMPSGDTIKDGAYTVSRNLYFVTKGQPTEIAKDFIDFVLSEEGQGLVEEEGFIRVN